MTMKIRAAIAAVVLAGSAVLPGVASAQMGGRVESRYGVLAGASINTITDLDRGLVGDLAGQLSTRSRIGGQAALYARIPLKGALSLQPELHYTQKGGKVEVSTMPQEFEAIDFGLKIGYVEIPVLARLDFGSGTWRPFITAGPTIALRTMCKFTAGSGSTSISTSCDGEDFGEVEDSELSDDPVRKMDAGASVGAGLAGSLMGRSMFVQLRYNQGLTSIAKDAPSSVTPRNRGFAMVVGLGF